MKNPTKLAAFLFSSVFLLFFTKSAMAVPLTLEGMSIVNQWIDLDSTFDEMPLDPWGTSDDLFADRVGIYVEFADGQTGSATYSGVSGGWNQCCADITGPDTTTGFFTSAILHGLNDPALPMAWAGLVTPYSLNFDLDYVNRFGSNFRASTNGWESAEIALYSSAAVRVPEPATLALFGLGLAGLGFARRKKA